MEILSVAPEALSRAGGIPVEIVPNDAALSRRFALEMADEIRKNNRNKKATSLILPVGPRGGYPEFVKLAKAGPIDLSGTTFFFMDEYILDDDGYVPEDHPLSFRGFVAKNLTEPLRGTGGFDPARVLFPEPGCPEDYGRRIERAGGIDVALCGVGIDGHVAFNEPEPGMSTEEFSQLTTRIVSLRPETRTINAVTEAGGAIDYIPKRAVTVGMAEILSARRIVVFMNHPWQRAAVRLFLFGDISPRFPVSLLRRHRELGIVITREVSYAPVG